MWGLGWPAELRKLLERYPSDAVGLQTIGYKEVLEHILNPQSLSEERTKELILFAHLQYVKRQKTWLRGLVSGS
jgi:tRNA A37 N6-isopentenylltransferase MiaA